nr:UDP-2,3-diacylglucosamine diphosphatase [Candidatus Cloacimonadota bacterium]
LKKLADLKESGCRIVFIAGNHDFWFGDFLTDFLQMEVHQEYFSEILNGKKYFFAHGDRYTTNDWRYQVFRTIIRSRIVMKIFELFHPDVALNIGKKLSRSSRFKKIPHKLQRLREIGLENSARKKLERFDVVVFGHSHLPKMKKFENGIYLNSGDWLIHNSYIRSLNGDLQICYYDENGK